MATTQPRVVVLTPVYNGAAFLREALVSVQAQSCPNLVHFVLDNASTDGTAAILREFRDARVPVVVERNAALLPLGENWNKCVALGVQNADYFRVLCADDTMEPTAMEKMVAVAEADRDVLLVGCHRRTSDGFDTYSWSRSSSNFDGKDVIRACFLGDTGFAPPHLLYRSSVLGCRPILFDEGIVAFDTDAALAIMALPKARFGFVHEVLAFTRRHATSITETVVSPTHVDYFDWLVMIARYGRSALSKHELLQLEKDFRRHYFARLLAWRFRQGNLAAFDWHMKALSSIDRSPGVLDYLDAVADVCLRKAGLRPPWDRYPQG